MSMADPANRTVLTGVLFGRTADAVVGLLEVRSPGATVRGSLVTDARKSAAFHRLASGIRSCASS